jgi:hypothetical protein
LSEHVEERHGSQTFHCSFCTNEFFLREQFLVHATSLTAVERCHDRIVSLNVRNREDAPTEFVGRFDELERMNAHQLSGQPIICDLCHERFFSLPAAQRHVVRCSVRSRAATEIRNAAIGEVSPFLNLRHSVLLDEDWSGDNWSESANRVSLMEWRRGAHLPDWTTGPAFSCAFCAFGTDVYPEFSEHHVICPTRVRMRLERNTDIASTTMGRSDRFVNGRAEGDRYRRYLQMESMNEGQLHTTDRHAARLNSSKQNSEFMVAANEIFRLKKLREDARTDAQLRTKRGNIFSPPKVDSKKLSKRAFPVAKPTSDKEGPDESPRRKRSFT